MAIFDPLILMAKLGLAVSFLLGIAVRPVALLGVLYAISLWIGLYRHPAKWPWEYIFIAIIQGNSPYIRRDGASGSTSCAVRRAARDGVAG